MGNLSNPYVGPRAYEPHETLYGRDREIRQLMALLVAERIVLLHSPSGAGKTSLLQAGLLPRMQADDFYVLPTVRVNLEIPNRLAGMGGNRYLLSTLLSLEEDAPRESRLKQSDLPGLSLDAYLARRYRPADASPSELLVFDQFEEVLTVAPSDREGKLAFFEQLGTALRNRNRWAIFSMREDYVAALAPYLRPIPGQLAASFRLDLLCCEAARQAIQKPAQSVGVDFQTEAAEKLVADLSQVQEQAPDGSIETKQGLSVEPVQLQVVCFRLWDAHAGGDRVITIADLGQVGSVDDSLAAYYAESVARVAASAGIEERAIREWFGTRLITLEGIRSQVLQRAEASDGLDNRAILQLVDTHILRSEKRAGSTWFELAHDRMIAPVRQSNAAWFKTNLRAFQVQAGLWDQQGRGEGLLLRGKALADAKKEAGSVKLTPVEQDFLAACEAARKREEREKRLTRIIAIAAVAASIAMIAAVVFGFSAEQQRQEAQNAKMDVERLYSVAQTSEAKAEEQAKIALSRQLIMQSQSLPNRLGEDYALKGLLAVEAARLKSNQLSDQTLNSFLQIPAHRTIKIQLNDPVLSVAYHPDGKMLASGDAGGNVYLWNPTDGQLVALFKHTAEVPSVAFSPNNQWLIAGAEGGDNTARVWDVTTKALVAKLPHDRGVSFVAFCPGGSRVITISGDASSDTVRVWKAGTNNLLATLQHEGKVGSAACNKDGTRVVTGSADGTVRLWDVTSQATIGPIMQQQRFAMQPGFDPVNSVAFDPSSDDVVISGGSDYTARIWFIDLNSEIPNSMELKHNGPVYSVALTNTWLISGSEDRTARVWDLAKGREQELNQMPHDSAVLSVVPSPDGNWVATSSRDNTVRVWNIRIDKSEQVAILLHKAAVSSVAFSPDNQWVASASKDKTIWLMKAVNAPDEVKEIPGDLIGTACLRLTRGMTASEWQQYITKEWEQIFGDIVPNDILPYELICPNKPAGGE